MTSEAKIIVSAEDRNTSRVFARVRAEIQGAGKSAEGLRAGLALLAPAVAGALSVAGIAAFVKGANEGLLKIKDLSEATGASIENISGLENVFRNAGGTIEDASTVLLRFNTVLKDADGKNGVSQVLKAIGLDAKALREQDPAQALLDFAVAFERFADNGEKGRALVELFGRQAKIAGGAIKDLAEAGRLNSTVTAEQVEQADRLNKDLAQLRANAEDVARAVQEQVVPAFNQLSDAIRGNGVGGSSAITELITVPLQAVSVLGANVAFVLKGIGTEIGGIAAQAAAFLSGNFAGARFIGEQMRQDAKAAREQFDALENRLLSIGRVFPQASYSNEGRGGARPSLPRLSGNGDGAARAAVQTDAERYLETLRRQLQGTQDLTLTETVLAEIRGGSLRNATASERQRALAIASEIEGTREVVRLARERSDQRNAENAEIDKFVAAQKAANEQRVRSILSATPTAQLKEALADIELISKEFDAGRISAEQWAEAVKGISAPLAAAGEEVQRLGTFAEQAGRNIQDALGETIKDTLKGDFDSIGELWRDLLLSMAAEAAAVRLNDALFGGIFGGSGEGGGLLGGLLKSSFGGFFASGGTLGNGKWGVAGEAGPELVRGPAQIVPLADAPAMGGTTVQIINNINGDVGPATVRLVESAMGRVKADILRSSRQGGAYAGAY